MSSNTSSIEGASGLERLAAAVDELAAQDLTELPDAQAARRVLVLRGLLERLQGQWLRELAVVDARGAAGADLGTRAESTAGWLRGRLRAGATQASGWVRVARALFRGPLAGTGQALAAGEITSAHAAVLAVGTQDLPAPTAAQAEPVLLEAARRLDPPRLRRLVAHLRGVADPDGAEAQARRRHEQRGLSVSPTFEGMVAIDGLLDPEAGETLLAALEPLARPASAEDERSGPQRRADALTELARRAMEGGRLPQAGGVRPQLTVTVELASLLGQPGLPGGEGGWTGSLPVDTCQRLACDAALTRVLVARNPPPPWRPSSGRRQRPACRTGRAGGTPAGRGGAAAGGPWRRPHPTVGGGPQCQGGQRGPAGRPGGPRRRLQLPRLRPAAGLVRSPPPAPPAARRPDRPGQPGAAVPDPPSCGARGRPAAAPRPWRAPDRRAAAPTTSHRRLSGG
jgi:Domain of unknown function (DUF222)